MENEKILPDFESIEERLISRHRYAEEEVKKIMPKLEEIDDLRRQKNAIILAHFYQIAPIQLIADVRGDSLRLAQAAQKIGDKNLVVCSTVRFMAEMVKLLSPDKKVVLPDLEASCSIAEGINGESVRKIREEFPGSAIIAYINTYADTKAEVDSVCTSANAREVMQNIEGNPVIMLPDYFFAKNEITSLLNEKNDGRTYFAYKRKSGNTLVLEDIAQGKEHFIKGNGALLPLLDQGTCIVHERFTPEEVRYYREKEKIDKVMAHPEVNPSVAQLADLIGGTAKMIEYVGQTNKQRYLVITECDLIAPLREKYPDKEFVTPCILCPYMKKNSLDGLINSLQNEVYEITLNPATSAGARRSLDRMFELTGGEK